VSYRQNGLHPGVLDATRLVTAGRLADATAILQRSCGIDAPGSTLQRRSRGLRDAFSEWLGRVSPIAPGEPVPSAPESVHRPGAGEFRRRAYRNETGVRQYRLYVPSGYHGSPAPPVV